MTQPTYSDGSSCDIGDVVKLRCGSPEMVVTAHTLSEEVIVSWTPSGGDQNEVLQEAIFPTSTLVFQR